MALHDLTVRGLDAHYGSAHILFGLELTVAASTTTAVVGRNGAGKTTLLRSITNNGVTATGRIRYGDTDLLALPPHRIARTGIQLVPEDRRIFAGLTVRQNLQMAAAAGTADRPARTVDEMVGLFPILGPLLGRPGYALSGGEQQLVAIARAMIANPRLLLLDEPSEGLAPRIVEQVGDAIRLLQRDFELSVLLAEQNTHFVLGIADDVCVIDAGRLVWHGSAEAFAADEQLQHRYLAI